MAWSFVTPTTKAGVQHNRAAFVLAKGICSQDNIDILPCSSGYSATIRTGVLGRTEDLDCPITTICENKKFLAKWTNKI